MTTPGYEPGVFVCADPWTREPYIWTRLAGTLPPPLPPREVRPQPPDRNRTATILSRVGERAARGLEARPADRVAGDRLSPLAQRLDSAFQIDRVPEHDRRDDDVQP